jgi:hypothetical protein
MLSGSTGSNLAPPSFSTSSLSSLSSSSLLSSAAQKHLSDGALSLLSQRLQSLDDHQYSAPLNYGFDGDDFMAVSSCDDFGLEESSSSVDVLAVAQMLESDPTQFLFQEFVARSPSILSLQVHPLTTSTSDPASNPSSSSSASASSTSPTSSAPSISTVSHPNY